jgi:ubiquinone/menaquinone biosynthesis C-methylase UbiE
MDAFWNEVYSTKKPTEVSWYQQAPQELPTLREVASGLGGLGRIHVADVGGGASLLVDALLAEPAPPHKLSVIDISGAALTAARARLGTTNAARVQWIEGSALVPQLAPDSVDIWHDRAVLHFMTTKADTDAYVCEAAAAVRVGGYVVASAFDEDGGPMKCSGLPVQRYTPARFAETFAPHFALAETRTLLHPTPFNTTQKFLMAILRRVR